MNYKKKQNQPIISEVSNNINSQIDKHTNLTFKTRNIFWTPFITVICKT